MSDTKTASILTQPFDSVAQAQEAITDSTEKPQPGMQFTIVRNMPGNGQPATVSVSELQDTETRQEEIERTRPKGNQPIGSIPYQWGL